MSIKWGRDKVAMKYYSGVKRNGQLTHGKMGKSQTS